MQLRREARSSPRSEGTRAFDLLRWAGNGAIGGLLATVVMTAYRMPVTTSLPPTAEFWARYVAVDDGNHPVAAVLLHLAYGSAAGSVFGVLYRAVGWNTVRDRIREPSGIAVGVLYGAVLSVVGTRLVLARLLSMDLDATETLVFHIGHVVFGLSLGSWISARSPAGDIDPE